MALALLMAAVRFLFAALSVDASPDLNQPGFLVGVDDDYSGGGNIINTLTNVADDRRRILLQVHISCVCCCLS